MGDRVARWEEWGPSSELGTSGGTMEGVREPTVRCKWCGHWRILSRGGMRRDHSGKDYSTMHKKQGIRSGLGQGGGCGGRERWTCFEGGSKRPRCRLMLGGAGRRTIPPSGIQGTGLQLTTGPMHAGCFTACRHCYYSICIKYYRIESKRQVFLEADVQGDLFFIEHQDE
jgi:hypothetical protein